MRTRVFKAFPSLALLESISILRSQEDYLVKYLSSILFLTLLAATTLAQEHASPGRPKAATLMSGLGDLHHPVSTSNPQAQQFFDQDYASSTLSITTKQHIRSSAPANWIPSSLWHIGESLK